MSTPASKVSFTVRRPTPISRPPSSGPESGEFKVPALPRHLASNNGSATGSPLAGSPRTFSSREDSDAEDEFGLRREDSSDEEDEAAEDELVTGFDHFGVQRLHEKKKKAPEAPLVIPSKPNPDWREVARKRRAGSRMHSYTSRATPSFVPDSARTATGEDGSVGGLGTRDTVNSGPQLAGLQVTKRIKVDVEEQTVSVEQNGVTIVSSADDVKMEAQETEDERALRAILAGDNEPSAAASVDVIPVPAVTEADAFQQDVEALPDVATVEDYARVPISAFGIAMLRGMGWTEGTVASKSAKGKKSGLIEPYLPQARPALLGIGAKEREPDDDGSGKMKKGREKRYVPVVKKEGMREENGGSVSGSISRRASRSPDRREGDRHSSDKDRSRYDHRERRRDEHRDYENRKRRTEGRDRDRDQRKDRGDWDRDSRRERDYEDRRKERDYNPERDRTRWRDREDADSSREGRSRRDRDRRD